MSNVSAPFSIANIRYFIAFRVFFNARFYYPVFTILFLDYGLTIEQFAILNSVWAATIVLAEVPSGALADLIGRKQLLLTTSVLMILEMLLLCFVPLENISLVFWAFLLNRIFSGLAEAMASGADEALAYDSLVKYGSKDDWPRVLSVMMRIKSIGSVITMSLGALIYDPNIVNKLLALFGSDLVTTQQTSMRFPVFLTLVLGVLSLYTVMRMKETVEPAPEKKDINHLQRITEALKLTWKAGGWILQTPFALVIILFAMAYDHALRMIITMTSQYFRLIDLPEASFGIIGAAMAMVGIIIPKIAEKMTIRFSALQNMFWMSGITILALIGIAAFVPYLGLIPIFLVSSGIMMTSFFTSHYLNRITESHQRATVLSFKGLAFNLAYGLIGVAFAALISELRLRESSSSVNLSQEVIANNAFEQAIFWFTPYMIIVLLITGTVSVLLLKGTNQHKLKG